MPLHATHLDLPLTDAALDGLRAGDAVELSGCVISFRDATAARLTRAIEAGDPLPVSLQNKILYAVARHLRSRAK